LERAAWRKKVDNNGRSDTAGKLDDVGNLVLTQKSTSIIRFFSNNQATNWNQIILTQILSDIHKENYHALFLLFSGILDQI